MLKTLAALAVLLVAGCGQPQAAPADAAAPGVDVVTADVAGTQPEVSFWFWNLWSRGLSAPNRAHVVAWGPDVMLFSDSDDPEEHALLGEEAGFVWGFHSGELFAISSKLPLGEVVVIHHGDITKRLLHAQLDLGGEPLHVFELHLKNPTKAVADEAVQAAEVEQILQEVEARSGHVRTLLIGDFNSRSPEDGETELVAGIARFLETGYVDAWKHLHSTDEVVPTKIARSFEGSRIDYTLVSPDLLGRVAGAGIATETSYPENSDHRAIWVRLDASP